jgi:hypothetical protein
MYSCALVDIVPVSNEQTVGVDQEQVFEEEEDEENQCLSKEVFSLYIFLFVLNNCMITKSYF